MTTLPQPVQPAPASLDQLTYEQAFAELESIVAALESNDRPLEEALTLYQRGQILARRCAAMLDQAELKVQQLSGDRLEDFPQQ